MRHCLPGQLRALAVVGAHTDVLQLPCRGDEPARVASRVPEVEARRASCCGAEDLAQEGHVRPLMTAYDLGEVAQLPTQRATLGGLCVERRLEILEQQRE